MAKIGAQPLEPGSSSEAEVIAHCSRYVMESTQDASHFVVVADLRSTIITAAGDRGGPPGTGGYTQDATSAAKKER